MAARRGGRGTVYTSERIEAALRKCAGSRTRAAQLLGCSRTTITRWLGRNPEFRQEMDAIVDANLDRAEQWLSKWIQAGDKQAVLFYLRTKGGYSMAQPAGADEPTWESPDLELPEAQDPATWTPPASDLPN